MKEYTFVYDGKTRLNCSQRTSFIVLRFKNTLISVDFQYLLNGKDRVIYGDPSRLKNLKNTRRQIDS